MKNQSTFSLDEIANITHGRLLHGSGVVPVRHISINSREISKDALFICIKGSRFDGHRFISAAYRSGASAVIVSDYSGRRIPKDMAVIQVADTEQALGKIARAHREKFKLPVIAITGSAGKTTTKEMVSQVLSARFNVLKNQGTQNNQIGVPLTLLKLTSRHDIVVLELGTNQPGDILRLAAIAQPTIAVFTNIGESHLLKLKSPACVYSEKKSMLKVMPKGSKVIVNADDPFLSKLPRSEKKYKYFTYGIMRPADFRAEDISIKQNAKVEFKVNKKHLLKVNTPVYENTYNALAAISCGRIFNISYNNINKNINNYKAIGRQQMYRLSGMQVIDDSYNANPISFRSALNTLFQIGKDGRRILVCGDMLELGGKAQKLHKEIGCCAGKLNIDVVLSLGSLSRHIGQAAYQVNPSVQNKHFIHMADLHRALKKICRKGDCLLIKGSRGMHMERMVKYLLKEYYRKG